MAILTRAVAPSTKEVIKQRQNPRQQRRMTTGEAMGAAFMATPFGGVVQGAQAIGAGIDMANQIFPGDSTHALTHGGQQSRPASQSPATTGGPGGLQQQAESYRNEALQSRAFIEAANSALNRASQQFNLFQTLEGEGLSPDTRRLIDQMKEDATREVNQINDQIGRYLTGIEVFNEMSRQGRAATEGAVATAQDVIGASRSAGQQNIEALAGAGVSGVEQAAAQATADTINAMGETQAQEGFENDLRVFGGVEGAQERPVAEQKATESIRELEGLVASNITDVSQLQGQINDAAANAASAQVELLGITDKKQRLQARAGLETSLRNSVYDLVQSRQSIQRELDRGISALEEEDAARKTGLVDQLGLGIDPTPQGIFTTSFIDSLDRAVTKLAPDLTDLQAEGLMAKAQLWARLGPGSPERTQEAIEIAVSLGVDPQEVMRALERSEATAAVIARQASNWDTNKQFTPGSPALVYGIYNTALELGWDPQDAAEWANSASLHQLIKQQSGGRVGASSGATLRGIGGLSEDIYSQLGIDYAEIEGDVHEEMKAFLIYVASVYGDPRSALSTSLDEQQFGVLPTGTSPVGGTAPEMTRGGVQ